jgi:hypothetical protein
MLYMFLLYWDDNNPPGDMDQVMAGHHAVAAAARNKDAYLYSEAIGGRANATTVRVREGEVMISDGPYAETKEVVGGFYVLDCADLDEALEVAARIPDAASGGVEVRPVMQVPGWDYGPTSARVRQSMNGAA